MKSIVYLTLLLIGFSSISFSQKENIFGKEFDLETQEHVEIFRKKIINNSISEQFDTIINSNDGFIFKFKKKDNTFFYYVTELGFLKLLCTKKDNIIRCFYGSSLEIIFEVNKENIIKWIQFNTDHSDKLRFNLKWNGTAYKINKCIGSPCPPYIKEDINGYLKSFQKNIIFMGMEAKKSRIKNLEI